jgi:hypothetical protein
MSIVSLDDLGVVYRRMIPAVQNSATDQDTHLRAKRPSGNLECSFSRYCICPRKREVFL